MTQACPVSVADIMTRAYETIEVDAMLTWAIHYLQHKCLSSIPVLSRVGNLAGILTEGDVMRHIGSRTKVDRDNKTRQGLRPWRLADHYEEFTHVLVGEVMTATVLTIHPSATVSDAIDVMLAQRVNSLPVVNTGSLVGVVYRRDLLCVLATMTGADLGASDPKRIQKIVN